MKQKIILIPMMLVALLVLSSCIVTSRAIGVKISCDEFTENPHSMRNEFQAEIGDKITVKLCSNPTTGFQWNYEMTIENVVKEEDHDFEAPEGDVPGAAGIELWTFEAIEKGTAEVQMEYSQPWEGGLKAEWTYTMTITVE
jgi:predicted secreted protein